MQRFAPATARLLAATLCLLFIGQAATIGAQDQPPLHERIDALIDAAAVGPIAPPASDADFVRRIYLDLTGVIPTPEETRAFLADQTPDKRAKMVEALLASPAFNRHLTLTFDVMLMERRTDKTSLLKPWLAYLLTSIAANKPLDQLRPLVRRLVSQKHPRFLGRGNDAR